MKMDASAGGSVVSAGASLHRRNGGIVYGYVGVVLALTLGCAIASFVKHDGPVTANVSYWFALVTFGTALASPRAGLLLATVLLTIAPSVHQQLNALLGTNLKAWTYPGVDCYLGFLAGWTLRWRFKDLRPLLSTFPSGTMIALHLWIVISTCVAIARNLWQSASEFSPRGLASQAWLLRKIGLHDDYLPLQDLYYFSVALLIAFAAWAMATREGPRLVRQLAAAVLVSATANGLFAAWQVVTRKGWFAGPYPQHEVNAFWPDLHAFGSFMAVAVVTGLGLLASRRLPPVQASATVAAMAVAAVALYLSGSRSTLVIVAGLLVLLACFGYRRARGWHRFAIAGAGLLMIGGLMMLFDRGYRGVSFATLRTVLGTLDPSTINAALAYRPEIWTASVSMYSKFPLFGLGQGELFRVSSIPEFAQSEVLATLGGGGAHNYFLQLLVELGPVALALFALLALPVFRLGRQNLRLISFWALLGVALGNLYAHSLLTREMLMLAALFAGTYVWEATTLAADRWRPPSQVTLRRSTWILFALGVAAFVEVILSFNRFPFTYGLRCAEQRPLTWDHWTDGALKLAVPEGATELTLVLAAERRDLANRALDVEVVVMDAQRSPMHFDRLTFPRGSMGSEHELRIPIDSVPGRRLFVEVRPSHCYVPLNVGRGHDGRHLGVRVRQLQFVAGGS